MMPPPPPPPRGKKKNKSSIKITINGKEINDIEDVADGVVISIDKGMEALDKSMEALDKSMGSLDEGLNNMMNKLDKSLESFFSPKPKKTRKRNESSSNYVSTAFKSDPKPEGPKNTGIEKPEWPEGPYIEETETHYEIEVDKILGTLWTRIIKQSFKWVWSKLMWIWSKTVDAFYRIFGE